MCLLFQNQQETSSTYMGHICSKIEIKMSHLLKYEHTLDANDNSSF